jgi:hypothetical protein
MGLFGKPSPLPTFCFLQKKKLTSKIFNLLYYMDNFLIFLYHINYF